MKLKVPDPAEVIVWAFTVLWASLCVAIAFQVLRWAVVP